MGAGRRGTGTPRHMAALAALLQQFHCQGPQHHTRSTLITDQAVPWAQRPPAHDGLVGVGRSGARGMAYTHMGMLSGVQACAGAAAAPALTCRCRCRWRSCAAHGSGAWR